MASFQSDSFYLSTLLHSSMFLPDDVWISRTENLSQLKQSSGLFSISDINDSDLYSTVEDIETASLFSDKQRTSPTKPKPSSKKHKKIHFRDEIDHVPPTNTTSNDNIDVKSIRSTIDKLGEHQPTTRSPKSLMKCRADIEPQGQGYLGSQAGFEGRQDSFSTELNNFMRTASNNTKKVLRKIKSGELVTSPTKLWRRSHAETTEGGSSESLSSAGPSAIYHLPRDMSAVSNSSPGGSRGTSDMDTPFNGGRVATRTVDNYWGQSGSQDRQGLLRRKASGALKYMQKWKIASKVGELIHRSRMVNDSMDTQDGETAWHSTSTREERCSNREESVRKMLAKSLSF